MKNLIMIVLMIAGFSGVAQEREIKSPRGSKSDLTPEQFATLQTKRMALALDLNDSQQQKMKALYKEDASKRKAKMEERKKSKEENKTYSKDERYKMQNERLDYQLARKKEMKSLLTEEQYAKWEQMKSRKRTHKGKNKLKEGKRKHLKRG